MRTRWLAVIALIGAASCSAAALAASGGARHKVTLSGALPSLVRQSQVVVVRGSVRGVPLSAQVRLEGARAATWQPLATARLGRHRGFVIRWPVGAKDEIGPIKLRVAVYRAGRLVAATAASQAAVGPAPRYCAPAAPPMVDIPVGSGWIVGGLYFEGGPFPGIYNCESQPYTISAIDSGGAVAATQHVDGGHSYTLVVPAGNYTLRASTCGTGSAAVDAGKQTKADTVCPVP